MRGSGDDGVRARIEAALDAEQMAGDYDLAADSGGSLTLNSRQWVVVADCLARAGEAGDEAAQRLLARVLLRADRVGTPEDPRHPEWRPQEPFRAQGL